MQQLEIFKKNQRRVFYMPDDLQIDVLEDMGTLFYDNTEPKKRKLMLIVPRDWGWVFLDRLSSLPVHGETTTHTGLTGYEELE